MKNEQKRSFLVPTDVDEQIVLDDMEQLSWPEMVGKEGKYAVQYIKEKSGQQICNFHRQYDLLIDVQV